MKRILISLATIGLVVGAVVAVTGAYFFNTEESTGNTFQAGTLDLSVPDPQAQIGFSTDVPSGTAIIEINNEAPGDSGTGAVLINNVGSLDGELDVEMTTITNLACDPDGRDDGSEYCDITGNLGSEATMGLYLDLDESRTFNAGDVELLLDGTTETYDVVDNPDVDENTIDSYDEVYWDEAATLEAVGGADETNLVINWTIPDDATNAIQGDGLTFEVTFTLEQAGRD